MKTYQDGLNDAAMLHVYDENSTKREIQGYRRLARSFKCAYFDGLADGLCIKVFGS